MEIKQVGRYAVDRNNSNAYRIYDPIDSLSPSLNTMAGGGREPMIIKYVCEYPFGGERKGIIDPTGVSRTLSATEYKQPTSIVLNALTPQKRIKNQEDEQGGIYVQIDDSHVIYALWQERYNGYIAIRKITPKECFRLQGWGDNYFKKAEMVNSDTQLYKQAGNGVTVNVAYEIGKALSQ